MYVSCGHAPTYVRIMRTWRQSYEKSVGCEFRTHIHALIDAGTVIAVYDPDNSLCEREVAAGVVAKMLGKQFQIIDPKTIKLS